MIRCNYRNFDDCKVKCDFDGRVLNIEYYDASDEKEDGGLFTCLPISHKEYRDKNMRKPNLPIKAMISINGKKSIKITMIDDWKEEHYIEFNKKHYKYGLQAIEKIKENFFPEEIVLNKE